MNTMYFCSIVLVLSLIIFGILCLFIRKKSACIASLILCGFGFLLVITMSENIWISEWIISIIHWLFQLLTPLFLASIIPLVFWLKGKKKVSILLFFSCLIITVAAIVIVSHHPILIIPKNQRQFVSADTEEQIKAQNTGIPSLRIPIFPIYTIVTYADDYAVKATTVYYFWGRRFTTIDSLTGEIVNEGPLAN